MTVKAIRYCWLFLTGVVCWIILHLFNRVHIIGRENMPRESKVLMIANHQSWIDSWVITFAAGWPWLLWKFSLAPWHTPDRKNFFGNCVMATMSWLSQCVPIDREKSRPNDIMTAAKKLAKGILMIFPEGGRHRGETQEARDTLRLQWLDGAAWLACLTQSKVVPIAIRGMSDLWPVDKWPRPFWKKIIIVIGEPIDLTSYWKQIGSKGFRSKKHREVMLEVSEVMKASLQKTLDEASRKFHEQ